MAELTARQKQFAAEYLIDLNATQAAVRAGYSVRCAKQQGARLLTLPAVQSAIAEAMRMRAERVEIDAAWVLRRLVDEANADLADLYDDNGNLRPVSTWPMIWRTGLVIGIETDEGRDEAGRVEAVVHKVRTSERIKRIELIGKHIGVQAFRERVEHDVTVGLAEQLRRERAERRARVK